MKNFKTLVFVALISTCLIDNQLNAWFPNIFGGTNTTCVNGNCYTCNGSITCKNGTYYCNGVKLTNGNEITDSGTIETKTMHIPGVNTIDISRIGNLTIEHCPTCEETLTVTADSNVLPHLNTDTYRGQLSLGIKDNANIQTASPVTFHAVVKQLKEIFATDNTTVETRGTISGNSLRLKASNNSEMTINVNTKELTVEGSNSAEITVTGQTDAQNINLKNTSAYDASGLTSNTVNIKASNSSFAKIMALHRINYTLYNSSSVRYTGNPELSGSKKNSSTIKQAWY